MQTVGMPEQNKPARVFISYSRRDLAFVERMAGDLKAAGLEVWYDLSGLKGGTRWGRETQRAIKQSQYFVVVLSPDSVESEWVEREFLYAGNQKLRAIPVLCRSCELPIWSLDVHYIDLRGKKYKENFAQLLKVLDVEHAEPIKDAEESVASESVVSSLDLEKEATKRIEPSGKHGLKARNVLAGATVLAIFLTVALIIKRPSSLCLIMPQLCPTPTRTPTATPNPTPYDGTWVGTTSQGYRLIFTVTHNVITYVYTTVHTESGDARCPHGVQTLVDTPVHYQIEGNTGSGALESDRITLRANGTFSFDTPASGTLFFVLKGDCVSSVNVTWTASRQINAPTSTQTPVAALAPSIQKALSEIRNATPLYETGFDHFDDFWSQIGNVKLTNDKLVVSSQGWGADGHSGTQGHITNSRDFAVVFDFHIQSADTLDGYCEFMPTTNPSQPKDFMGYDFIFRYNGAAVLGKLGPSQHLETIAAGERGFDVLKFNKVTVIIVGNEIAAFLNDQLIYSIIDLTEDTTFTNYDLGADSTAVCEYDNFWFWDLSGLNP